MWQNFAFRLSESRLLLSFPRNCFSHGSVSFPLGVGLFLLSNSQVWSKRFPRCFLAIPSQYPPMICINTAAEHVSCSLPAQTHYFCSVIFREVDIFPFSTLSLPCKSFPIPQTNQKHHGLKETGWEQQEKQTNNTPSAPKYP